MVYENHPGALGGSNKLITSDYPGPATKEIPLEEGLSGGLKLRSEVNAISIGPLALLAVPGELYPELWLTGEGGQPMMTRPEGGYDIVIHRSAIVWANSGVDLFPKVQARLR